MGCDIHFHSEVKIGGIWHHYGAPHIDRFYRLFSLMADVRNYHEQKIRPVLHHKGLPSDLSVITRLAYHGDDGDAHSMTWLDANGIAELYRRFSEIYDGILNVDKTTIDASYEFDCKFGYLFHFGFGDFADRSRDSRSCPKEIEDVRFVFWFDN